MDFILNDYLDSTDSAFQYDAILSMSQDFQFKTEFEVANSKEQFNDLPF